MRFRAELQLFGRTATGLVVPEEIVTALDGGRRPAVTVRIGAYSWRTTIAPYGGQFLLGISAENRAGAGVSAGDLLDVDVALDTAPREVEVPGDLAAALKAAGAGAAFDKLSYTYRKEHVAPSKRPSGRRPDNGGSRRPWPGCSASVRDQPGGSSLSRTAKLAGRACSWYLGRTPGPHDALPNPFWATSRLR